MKCRVCELGAKTAGRTCRKPNTCWTMRLCDKCYALMEFFNFSNHSKSYMTWFYVPEDVNHRTQLKRKGIRVLTPNPSGRPKKNGL